MESTNARGLRPRGLGSTVQPSKLWQAPRVLDGQRHASKREGVGRWAVRRVDGWLNAHS